MRHQSCSSAQGIDICAQSSSMEQMESRSSPAITERLEDIVAGAMQRQAVARVEQPPQRRRAFEVDHLLNVQLDLHQMHMM